MPVQLSKYVCIVWLVCLYSWAKVPLSLPSHGRGNIFSRLWEDPTTAVERSRHGRDKLMIKAPEGNYPYTLIQQQRQDNVYIKPLGGKQAVA